MESPADAAFLPSRPPFAFHLSLSYFERRAGELVDRAEDGAYRRLLLLGGRPALVEARAATETAPGLWVRIVAGDKSQLPEVASALRRSFGLDDDLDAFRDAVAGDSVLSELIERYPGLRLVRTQSAFEALVWAIIGQQINLTLAFRLKSAIVRSYGAQLISNERTYWAFPRPEDLAVADPDHLASSGLSRRKAASIIAIARAIVSGELDLDGLVSVPRPQAEARLVGLAGVGPWTAHYTLLRGLGDVGAFPGTDLGLRAAVGRLYGFPQAAPLGTMRELAERWGEWRGYAAFYLWNSLAGRGA